MQPETPAPTDLHPAPAHGPAFDRPVPPGGYAWWYVDGISDCGGYGLTLIAFIGSVFSPYYAWAGRREPADHCAVNLALYRGPAAAKGAGVGPKRWAMTERGRKALAVTGESYRLGASSLAWRGDRLEIAIDERCMPIPLRLRGRIRVTPKMLPAQAQNLDPAGRHIWQPIAPAAEIDCAFDDPALAWRGAGYLDANFGSEPLEAGFRFWSWSRSHGSDAVTVLYDAERRDGSRHSHAVRFDAAGRIAGDTPPPASNLPRGVWGVARPSHSDPGSAATLQAVWEDTPFYTRSAIRHRLFGEDATSVHESLDLDRFAAPWVRCLLPFRMPRLAGGYAEAAGIDAA